MRGAKRVGWMLLLAGSISATAWAQQGYVDIEQRLSASQLADIGLSAQQLAKLNGYLRDAQAAAPPVETARYETAQGQVRDPSSLIGLADKPIKSRLKGDVSGWAPGTVFELENGQQWKVLKGSMTLRRAITAPEIVVVPGIAGRWFLQVDEDLPKARVYRID